MKRRIHELIEGSPSERIAVIDDDGRSYSYADLDRISDGIAQKLRGHGVRGGDRVILLAENGMTYAAAILAISKVDAWVVPVNARVTERDIKNALTHSGARCIFYTVDDSSAALAHSEIFGGVDLGQEDCGRIVVSPVVEVEPEPVEAGADQVAALFYTSGTTGTPKGVMLTHANLIFAAEATSGVRGMEEDDIVLGVLPGTHVYGFGGILFPVWDAGATIRLMPRFEPKRVLEALRDNITLFPAVPQMYAALLKEMNETGIDRVETPLRIVSSGGAPLDPNWKAEIERRFGIHMHNGYGMTEASPTISVTRLDDLRTDTSVGLALPGLEIKLRNESDDGAGELCVRGPNVMKGYYKDPDATAKAMTADGFLKTGDVGRIDPDGAIHIVGRCKELIVHSGFNVYPAEVESALNAHSSVVQSAVVGRARDGNEDVIAFVTLAAPVTEPELRAWMRSHLVSYKVPLHIIPVESLPQAATGKILKGSLTSVFDDKLRQLDLEKNA